MGAAIALALAVAAPLRAQTTPTVSIGGGVQSSFVHTNLRLHSRAKVGGGGGSRK